MKNKKEIGAGKQMVKVIVNKAQFEYDIHSLVKAFYPGEDVKVLCGEKEDTGHQEAQGKDTQEKAAQEKNLRQNDDEMEQAIRIYFEADGISMESAGRCSKVSYEKDTERAEVKNLLKQLIYQGLAEKLGKELPWGTLTGIRPTKIPMTMLSAGKRESEIMDYMKETYFISDEKGTLSIDIARRERELLSSLHYADGYSLYIGIPFCPTTCLYCSFTSYPICAWKEKVGDYLDALAREMEYVAEAYKDKTLDTVYIGGGTPTTLEAEELDRLLSDVNRFFDMQGVLEFTVEAGRADSITRDKLRVLKKHKVSRISVNPQTMNEETLRVIGRRHSVEQVKEAFAMAREEGFDNINMDIILGLPGESAEDVRHTVEEIKKLAPDSLTVHSLAIKRASRLSQWIEENGISTLHNTDETMHIAAQAAEDMGMKPYYLYRQKNMSGNFENVGYAGTGKEGIYNILIMEELQTIAALGAGSISKVVYPDGRIERADSVKDVGLYIERIDEMIDRKRKLFYEH